MIAGFLPRLEHQAPFFVTLIIIILAIVITELCVECCSRKKDTKKEDGEDKDKDDGYKASPRKLKKTTPGEDVEMMNTPSRKGKKKKGPKGTPSPDDKKQATWGNLDAPFLNGDNSSDDS